MPRKRAAPRRRTPARRRRRAEDKPPFQRHRVSITLKAWDLAKAGAAAKFKIRNSAGEIFGTIEIGQGSLGWRGAHGKKGFKRFSWREVAEILEDA